MEIDIIISFFAFPFMLVICCGLCNNIVYPFMKYIQKLRDDRTASSSASSATTQSSEIVVVNIMNVVNVASDVHSVCDEDPVNIQQMK
jgi:hypothetical protein